MKPVSNWTSDIYIYVHAPRIPSGVSQTMVLKNKFSEKYKEKVIPSIDSSYCKIVRLTRGIINIIILNSES